MSLRLNSNLTSFTAATNLNRAALNVSRTVETVASGRRVNHSSDDASGLLISKFLEKDVASMQVAVRNANELVNALQITDSASQELAGTLIRLRSLVMRGANGVLGDDARLSIQSEIDQLVKEIIRTGQSLRYDGTDLGGTAPQLPMQMPTITLNETAAAAVLGSASNLAEYNDFKSKLPDLIKLAFEKVYGMTGLVPPEGRSLTVTLQGEAAEGSDGIGNVLATGGGVSGGNMTLTIDLADFLDLDDDGTRTTGYKNDAYSGETFTPDSVLTHEIAHAVVVALGGTAASGGDQDNQWGNHLVSNFASEEVPYRITSATESAIQSDALDSDPKDGWPPGANQDYAEAGLIGIFMNYFYGRDAWQQVVSRVAGGSEWDSALLAVTGFNNTLSFGTVFHDWAQRYLDRDVWSDVQQQQGLTPFKRAYFETQVGTENTPADRLAASTAFSFVGSFFYLVDPDVTTQSRAQRSLSNLDHAMKRLSMGQAVLGAGINRLEKSISELETRQLSTTASLSTVRDADMANAIAKLTRQQLLSQSGAAALSRSMELDSRLASILLGSI